MEKENDYATDSESSDEDFCPENAGNEDLSEESSDDEIEDEDEAGAETGTNKNTRSKKNKSKSIKSKVTTKKNTKAENKRTTRQSDEAGKTEKDGKNKEKDILESDEEEKERSDALWADFLGNAKEKPIEVKKRERTPSVENAGSAKKTCVTTNSSASSSNRDNNKTKKTEESSPRQMTITEIMDFAGEEIHVQKIVKTDSIKENKAIPQNNRGAGSSSERFPILGAKRNVPSSSGGGGASGLGSILNNIGKKKKISVLEKTKLDWNTFKKDEGIEEELQTFNKGKDGYLERQDFLERTDVRQFEIEKNLRQSRRNP